MWWRGCGRFVKVAAAPPYFFLRFRLNGPISCLLGAYFSTAKNRIAEGRVEFSGGKRSPVVRA
eukprot:5929527-Pyramimonas_sp.AAC.1